MLPIIGQVLRISFPDRPGDGEYKATVIAFDVEAIITTIPMSKTSSAQTTAFSFVRERPIVVRYHGPDGAIVFFPTRIKTLSVDPPQLEIYLAKPEDIHREQRRQYVRVPVSLPIRIETYAHGAAKLYDLEMRDLSGGGLSILLPPKISLSVGEDLRARFTLPNRNIFIDVKCQVVRISDRNEFNYAVASAQFIDITEVIRQKIIQYTFVRQRELLILKQDISRS